MIKSIITTLKDLPPTILAFLNNLLNSGLMKIENYEEHKKSFIFFWVIFSFSIIAFVWATFAKLDTVIRADGYVIPASNVHMVQNLYSERLNQINIELGDKVSEGDILFIFDNKQALTEYKSLKQEVEERRKKVAILENLLNEGAVAEMTLIDEKMLLNDAEKRFKTSEIRFENTSIKSPVDGIISQVHAINVGQVMDSGSPLAEIVPIGDKLRIEVNVQLKDIADVKEGMLSKVGFTAYDIAVWGQVDGIVKTVSASTKVGPNEVPYYPAIIEVDTEEIKKVNDMEILTGMQANASIIGQKRTVLSYLINPITKLSKKAFRE